MDIVTQRRGKRVSILGWIFQVVLGGTMVVVWLCTGSPAALAATLLIAAGKGLWIMAAVLFYCRQLQQQEQIELQELSSRAKAGTIFESERSSEMRPAANRLAWILKWVVPIYTLLFAAGNILAGVAMLRLLAPGDVKLVHDNVAMIHSVVFCVIGAFLAFMLSRYCTGMGSQEVYRPLRAAGSFLLVNVLAVVAVVVSLAFDCYGRSGLDLVVGYVLPAIQIVLGAELALNFLLDIYRPRMPGQEQRLAYDSRLFNLVAEPGRVGHSIAETLNYQFGFEVSKTWFYQLLSRAMLPMLALGVLVLLALSSVVIVPDGEKAAIFRWGKYQREVEAGQYLKLPWPIDTADRFNVAALHDVYLGAGEKRDPRLINGREVNLWTEEHGRREEKDFLLAVPEKKELRRGNRGGERHQAGGAGAVSHQGPPQVRVHLRPPRRAD